MKRSMRLTIIIIQGIFALHILTNTFLMYAANVTPQDSGEISVNVRYGEDPALLTKYHPILQCYLLTDSSDILSQIEQLKEQSKAQLEPLIKQYMLVAETLSQITLNAPTDKEKQAEKNRLHKMFNKTEKTINNILEQYRAVIDSIIHHHTIRTCTMSLSSVSPQLSTLSCQFRHIPSGGYRIYGVLIFSTTKLTWFEPVSIKGGDSYTVNLNRDNIKNPDWTELNWWSFMNLDFSKHH